MKERSMKVGSRVDGKMKREYKGREYEGWEYEGKGVGGTGL
jgi:hypothetical protein